MVEQQEISEIARPLLRMPHSARIPVFFVLFFSAAFFMLYFFTRGALQLHTNFLLRFFLLLFFFTVVNSLILVSQKFSRIFLFHAICGITLFLFIFLSSFPPLFALIGTAIYILFELISYKRVQFLMKDRLKIRWQPLFRATWNSVSFIFTVIFSLSLIMFSQKYTTGQNNIIFSALKSAQPIFQSFHAPSPDMPIGEYISKQADREIASSGFIQQQARKLKQQIVAQSIQGLNQKFGLHLTENATFQEAVLAYFKYLWLQLNPKIRFFIKILLFTVLVFIFQPLFVLLGNFLGIFSIPIYWFLKYIGIFDIGEEHVTREIISI